MHRRHPAPLGPRDPPQKSAGRGGSSAPSRSTFVGTLDDLFGGSPTPLWRCPRKLIFPRALGKSGRKASTKVRWENPLGRLFCNSRTPIARSGNRGSEPPPRWGLSATLQGEAWGANRDTLPASSATTPSDKTSQASAAGKPLGATATRGKPLERGCEDGTRQPKSQSRGVCSCALGSGANAEGRPPSESAGKAAPRTPLRKI